MAISKTQAEKIEKDLLDKELEKIIPLERSTDAKLSTGIRDFEFPGIPPKVLKIFLDKYRTLGWKIVYRSDYRNGGYYTFE